MKHIALTSLICMNECATNLPLRTELAYAQDNNLLFGERIYRPDAKLYLHKFLADIVIKAAQSCHDRYMLRFVLYDGLRTVDAQAQMMETQRVKDNPHWLEEPRLLSPPGSGGHPRAMAIDIGLETMDGTLLDMGTPFDYLAENANTAHNTAHRAYAHHSPEIMQNRQKLDSTMIKAAQDLGTPLLPLPEEWWDFRLPPEISNEYAPIKEQDLPSHMRLL
jgi:D-alanyl-D-alanine dipeptidase